MKLSIEVLKGDFTSSHHLGGERTDSLFSNGQVEEIAYDGTFNTE